MSKKKQRDKLHARHYYAWKAFNAAGGMAPVSFLDVGGKKALPFAAMNRQLVEVLGRLVGMEVLPFHIFTPEVRVAAYVPGLHIAVTIESCQNVPNCRLCSNVIPTPLGKEGLPDPLPKGGIEACRAVVEEAGATLLVIRLHALLRGDTTEQALRELIAKGKR